MKFLLRNGISKRKKEKKNKNKTETKTKTKKKWNKHNDQDLEGAFVTENPL